MKSKTSIAIVLAVAIVASSVSASVIPDELTEQKCGNGIREGYELCEPGTAYDLCPSIGKLLKIAMVCNEQTCACLPGRSAKDCGNGIREGVEMCDPGTKERPVDFCPNVSMAIGIPLVCDQKTCDCVPSGPLIKLSTCGDGKVEGDEDCESDDDCPRTRECKNCTCVLKEENISISPVQNNVTTDELPVPTIDDITRKAGKTEIAGFVIEDYVGEIIPDELDYFDNEEINVYIKMNDGTAYVASAITTKMVVQEVHPYALNDSSMEVWVTEEALNTIRESDRRTEAIVRMLSDGTISYRPTGFFRRIWFWLFRPY
ncbi:MAG: hypothetical protein QXR48_01950 [Candidatus Woesearchaeota archaeon]